MASADIDINSIMENRRQAVEASLQQISVDELKDLGEQLFPYIDHPWRDTFFQFIEENLGATFYHGATHDRIHILYCSEKEKGIWFQPGNGRGPMQARELAIMKEIVDLR
jgi:hypothetical protein